MQWNWAGSRSTVIMASLDKGRGNFFAWGKSFVALSSRASIWDVTTLVFIWTKSLLYPMRFCLITLLGILIKEQANQTVLVCRRMLQCHTDSIVNGWIELGTVNERYFPGWVAKRTFWSCPMAGRNLKTITRFLKRCPRSAQVSATFSTNRKVPQHFSGLLG